MRNVEVIYSVGVPLGDGMGGIASFASEGVRKYLTLKTVLAPSVRQGSSRRTEDVTTMTFPAYAVYKLLERSGSNVLKDSFFDVWASRHIQPCHVFYGWAHMSLYSLRAAGRYGAKTVVDRGSAEIRVQKRLLDEEYSRFGRASLISGPSLRRHLREEEEADLIAVPSRFVFDSFREMGFPEKKLFINPLGVDLERFRSTPIPQDAPFRVVYMGVLSLQKGIHYLLKAWERLRLRDAELHLSGEILPEIRPDLERAVSQGIKVHAGGGTPHPEKVYDTAHIVVLFSVQDGFGSVVLEAMASGRPVIVSENVGAKDCVRDGVDGFVVPARSLEPLMERIAYFHGNRDKIREMGENARKRAEEFTWGSYQERLAGKLKELADA